MKKDEYGCIVYSLDEEAALPDAIKDTRNNKYRVQKLCDICMKRLGTIKSRAYQIPEEDDELHAKLVDEFTELMVKATETIKAVWEYGY